MNPYFPLSTIILVGILVFALMIWLIWRSSSGIPAFIRAALISLRVIGLSLLLAFFLNPGEWKQPLEKQESGWQVLIDQSSSMAMSDVDGKSRWETASQLADEFLEAAQKADFPVEIHPFGAKLHTPTTSLTELSPTLTSSDINLSARTLLDTRGTSGFPITGVIVLSDGRQTVTDPDVSQLTAAALASSTPLHTYTLGGKVQPPDVELSCKRLMITGFEGQNVSLPVELKSHKLGALRLDVSLTDAKGALIHQETVEHPGDDTVKISFPFIAPDESTQWTLAVNPIEGEVSDRNNSESIHLRIIDSKTNVLMIEGAPYWDSKFLAQMLRRQEHISIRAIYRLSSDNYFEVSTKENDPKHSKEPVFPDTLAEISEYDLIVLGKNIEPFLTPERVALIKSYVQDQGGALLFSRGKPYSKEFPLIEPLEPTTWARGKTKDFRMIPTPDGENTGLFGQALPSANEQIWESLPLLTDATLINQIKPFSRVLAEGRVTTSSERFPLLILRRYGQGVSGVMNADGLWKWDFFPKAREHGNMYLEFWTQFLQWMASYSEFLPGQDYSLQLSQSQLEIGQTVGLRVAYRGKEAPAPKIIIENPDGSESLLTPARLPDVSRPEWRASFQPPSSGFYTFKVSDPNSGAAMPTALLNVPAAPTEVDELSADPHFMELLATSTKGEVLNASNWDDFLKDIKKHSTQAMLETSPEWAPKLHHWIYGLFFALIFSLEWWLRRRYGLS